MEFEVFHDSPPTQGTFVELDPEVKDKWGLPVARINVTTSNYQKLVGQWLMDRGLEILKQMGAEDIASTAIGSNASFMIHGTCRAGKNPSLSVLNEFCQMHDVPNLFVVDGSFMPTSGGVPTTLTILANSFRTAEYIWKSSKTGDLA